VNVDRIKEFLDEDQKALKGLIAKVDKRETQPA
jgi:hypothetical protein